MILALGQPETATAITRRGRPHGLPLVAAPTLRSEPGDLRAMDAAARRLGTRTYDGVCLTSAAAVDALAAALERTGTPTSVLDGVVVGTVGAGTTRRLRQCLGRVPTTAPPVATGRALGQAMAAGNLHLLLPQSDLASSGLQDALEAQGHRCETVQAYRTVAVKTLPSAARRLLHGGRVRLVVVTSPSCVRAWAKLASREMLDIPTVSIGPLTTRECRRHRLDVMAEAAPHDAGGIVAALVHVYPT